MKYNDIEEKKIIHREIRKKIVYMTEDKTWKELKELTNSIEGIKEFERSRIKHVSSTQS